MRYRVDDLSGAILDYAVALIEGYSDTVPAGMDDFANFTHDDFCPSIRWAHGGPIIDKFNTYRFEDLPTDDGQRLHSCHIFSSPFVIVSAFGDTPLIAAMRCYVKSHCGEFVELNVPEGT